MKPAGARFLGLIWLALLVAGIALKLLHIYRVHWIWVMAPLWLPMSLFGIAVSVSIAAALLVVRLGKVNPK